MRIRAVGWDVLMHPAFTGSVALLVVNDRVLKAAWPGIVTGKLSDLAGVSMVVLCLTAITRRPRFSASLTTISFMLLKLWPPVAMLAAPVLGGVTLTDPTDLLVLAVMPLLLHALGGGHDARQWFLARSFAPIALVLAVHGTTATSCASTLPVTGYAFQDTTLFVRRSLGNNAAWSSSIDGGHTWTQAAEPTPRPTAEPLPTEACTTTDCFVAVPGVGVEERAHNSGPVRTAFSWSASDRKRLHNQGDPDCGGGSPDTSFTGALVVPMPDGEHVVVGMGGYGVLHRTPSGRWERPRIPTLHGQMQVPEVGPPTWFTALGLAPLLTFILSFLLFGFRSFRGTRRAVGWGVLLGTLSSVVLAGLFLIAALGDARKAGAWTAAASVGLFALSLYVALRPAKQPNAPVLPSAPTIDVRSPSD